MSENNNENYPTAMPVSASKSTSASTLHTIDITDPQLYDTNPHTMVQRMNDDIPIRALQMAMMETEIEEYLKGEIFHRARMVKIISIVDIFFLTLNLIFSILNKNLFFLFFALCPLCISGYYGANTYKPTFVMGYIVYLCLMDIYYVLLFFYYNNIFIILFWLIETYFLFYTYKFYNCINRAKDETIESVRDGWEPVIAFIFH
jgi:hypothetical protein